MKKIAALVDIDIRLKSIIETAFLLAEQNSAELIIYHHLMKNEKLVLEGDTMYIDKERDLMNHIRTFSSVYDVKYKIIIGGDGFKKGVIQLVAEENIDLIIIGSNGRSNTTEQIFGSNAEKIIESAPSSVLVLKEVPLNHNIKNVVFASSFNEMDQKAFQYFLQKFHLPKETTIHLLMVDTYSFFNQPNLMVEECFETFSALARPFETKHHFYHGISIEKGIKSFLDENNPDLLVMSNKYSRLIRSALSSGSKMIKTLHINEIPFLNIDYDSSVLKDE